MLLGLALAHAVDDAPLGRVLAACVANGKVDYACVRDRPGDLGSWLAGVAGPLPSAGLGVWIDVYNALVLDQLATASLPRRVTDLAGFFDKRYHPVDGRRVTLNELEGELRTKFADPRLHFALNCGARSCPPLQATPWPDDAAALEAALELATRRFLDGPGAIVDDSRKTLFLSKLFDWYAKDFAAAGGAVAFVRGHAGPTKAAQVERAVAGGYTVKFLPYDWTPNSR